MKKYLLRAPAQQNNEAATFFNSKLTRSGGELITICKALLADGVVNPAEANFLQSWLKENHAAAQSWPFVDLIHRLDAIFADGQASAEECEELAVALHTIAEGALVRSDPRLPGYGMAGAPVQIFDSPAPAVEFAGREFCATGVFLHGTRGAVEKAIQQRGGSTIKAPRASTNYVLVGSFVSPGWSNGHFGSKLIRAMSLKRNGASVAIIGEEHWAKYLGAKENFPTEALALSRESQITRIHRPQAAQAK
jgi:NAD-dependent DNA ligase